MNLITIIVPMYNEQENIKNCVDCLRSQTNQNFSVIFVDDGSVDYTLNILEKHLNCGVNFDYEILTQENQGAAAARENGIKCAKTEYIAILDCDDEVSNNLIEQISLLHSINKDIDIIIPDMLVQDKENNWTKLELYTEDQILNPMDCLKNSLGGWKVHGCFAIKKVIFSKSYDDYLFYNKKNENYINNDEVITRLNFYNSKSIVRSKAVYYYHYNFLSTTKRLNSKKYLTINNALILKNIFGKDPILRKSIFNELIATIWGNYLYLRRYKNEFKNISKWENTIKYVINELGYFDIIASLDYKRKIQFSILKVMYLF